MCVCGGGGGGGEVFSGQGMCIADGMGICWLTVLRVCVSWSSIEVTYNIILPI